MEIVASALSSVLPKLSAVLAEEYKLTKGLKDQIRFIGAELQCMQEFILRQEEEEAEPGLEQARFLRDLRELSYDTEDILDGLMLEEDPASKVRMTKGLLRKFAQLPRKMKSRRQIASDIEEIKLRFKEIEDRCRKYQEYKVDSVATRQRKNTVDPRLLALYADASALVGLDGPLVDLSKLLLLEGGEEPESAAQLKVISIVGFGGMGKTTLAREVCHKTQAYFEHKVFVSVSPKPDETKILNDILNQCNPCLSGHDSELSIEVLITKIRQFLQDKRYLIVMDDVWSPNHYDIIRCALPMNSLGSRIIVTTRINSVAESCCSHWNDHIYNINPLGMKDSRLLFHKRIFGSEDKCPPELEGVSDKILNKCSGLPLAIITMAGLLASKPLVKPVWEELCNSVGSTPERIEGMKSIFFLSYYDLPLHLMMCFLYLSKFPEDYPINHDRVVRSWIAEGFIRTKHGITAEEVGESYLSELVNRHMLQPVHGSYGGKAKAYLINGIMLDLIKSKATEENFITVLDSGKHVPVLPGKIRRLSMINSNEDNYMPKLENRFHIRSLSIFGIVGLNLFFESFTFLRVLDLEGCKDLMDHNVKKIAGLMHLRYLSLRDTNITKLPDKIGQLHLLNTLDLRGTKVQEVPSSIVQLQMLQHLLSDKMRLPEGLGKMRSLYCLSQFDILQSEIPALKELGNLSRLRELVLWWFPNMESNNIERYEHLAFSLYRLDTLQSLYIHGGDSSVDFLDHLRHPLQQLRRIQLNSSCYLNRIPEWFTLLPILAYLSIDIKEVKNEELRLLSKLQYLRHLSLSSKIVPTEKLVISSHGFHVLGAFHLYSARADLTFEPEAMPNLEKLLLSFHVLPEEKYDFSISISQFERLRNIDIRVNGKGADASQSFKAIDAAIRKAAETHRNRPTVDITMLGNLMDHAAKEGREMEPIEVD